MKDSMASLPPPPPHDSARPSRVVVLWQPLAALRIGRSVGLAMLLGGQLQYESWTSRVVLDRWSLPAAGAILLVALLLLASSIDTLIRARRGAFGKTRAPVADSGAWFDLAILFGGAAYLGAALDDPMAGGRLLELDLLGSHFPPSIGLEWLAMASATAGVVLVGWRQLRPRAPGLYMLVASCALIAILGEGITRAANTIFPATQGFPTASTELWMRRFGQLNSLGYRDHEHALTKPAGVIRILMIGDSFTFAMGIERREDRVSDRLASELPGRVAKEIEVINAGRPYTHTLQQIDALKQLLEYQPDLVLLVYVFNDIDYLRSSVKPSAALADDGSFMSRLHPMRLIYLNSFLAQQIFLRARHVYWSFVSDDESPVSAYEDPELVQRHIGDLRRFVELARAGGAEVAIVPFDPGFAQTVGNGGPRLDFLARARAEGIPFWPLDQVFDGVDYDELVVNPMDHHPNALANRILADALVVQIEQQLRARPADRVPR